MSTYGFSTAFLRNDDCFLLLKRGEDRRFYPGVWAGVGGHVKDEEMSCPERACLREIQEETGITEERVTNLRLRYISVEYRCGDLILHYIYFGEARDRALTGTDEGELFWVHQGDVPEVGFSEVMRFLITHYFNIGTENNYVYMLNEKDMDIRRLS